MASVVSICNLALGHLGKVANISSITPPDGSRESVTAAQFYPIARDEMLSRGWGFATARVLLSTLEDPTGDWAYRYALPSDLVGILTLGYEGHDGAKETPFAIEDFGGQSTVLTNLENAELRYTFRVEDTSRFPADFTTALSWLLASYMAGPLTQNLKLAQFCAENAKARRGEAAAAARNAERAATKDAIGRAYPIPARGGSR